MILVTACFPIEARWIARRPGLRLVRTAVGERSHDTMDGIDRGASSASLLLAVGFCGGLDPRLKRGDLVLAAAVRDRIGELPVDPHFLDRARHALRSTGEAVHVGAFACADHVLRPDEKRAMAEDGLVAVDMETGPLARWAAERAVPFLALRVVLDPADADVPFATNRPFWSSAVRHPIAAARLARGAAAAGRTLGRAVGLVADALGEGADD